MSEEERHISKPLVVGAAAAGGVVAVAWLAHGLRRGRPLPQSVDEAVTIFFDPHDPYHAPAVKSIGELLVDSCVPGDELYQRVADRRLPGGEDMGGHTRLEFDRALSLIRDVSLGDLAFVRNSRRHPGFYKPTRLARELHDAHRLGPFVQAYIEARPVSDNS